MALLSNLIKDKTKYYIPDRFYENKNPLKRIGQEVNGKISKELGETLEKMFDDPKFVLCIHRTVLDSEYSQRDLGDIFNNGLKNFGGHNIENTMTICRYFPVFLAQIIGTPTYRQGSCRGAIIAKIPKKDLGLMEGEVYPIWFKTGEKDYRNIEACNLLPEYIVGYLSSDVIRGGKFGDMILNPNYQDIHDYQHTALFFDDKAIEYLRKNKKEINRKR